MKGEHLELPIQRVVGLRVNLIPWRGEETKVSFLVHLSLLNQSHFWSLHCLDFAVSELMNFLVLGQCSWWDSGSLGIKRILILAAQWIVTKDVDIRIN